MNKYLLFLFFIFFVSNKAQASHAMGAEITYVCLGTNQYEITYTFYRDCNGIDAPPTVTMEFTNSCGIIMNSVVLNPASFGPELLNFGCPQDSTTCTNGIYLGVEKWIYTGMVVLPGECADWKMGHAENSRNTAITTLSGSSDNLYVYALLNNTNGLCNSSPVFSVQLVPSVCVNEHYCLLQGSYDAEGDSLTYQMITPLTGATTTVAYLPNYSAAQPVLSNPPVTINNATGEICITPTQQDVTPMAILIREFREGILIGEVERDIQLNVDACTNTFPRLTGLNGSHDFDAYVCAGQMNCFVINTVDANISDTTTISIANSIPGMTFNSYSAKRDSAYICWTPSMGDTLQNPHCIYLSVFDNSCPHQGSSTKEYCFNVVAGPGCSPMDIKNSSSQSDIRIFYSPSNTSLNIISQNTLNPQKGLNYSVASIFGQGIFNSKLFSETEKINIENLKEGIYFVYIYNDQGKIIAVEKILIID